MPRKKIHGSLNKKSSPDKVSEELFRPFEKYYNLKKYDRTLRDYRDKLKTLYSKAYDENVSELRKDYDDKEYRAFKLDNVYRKRRISAFVDVAAEAAEKYDEKYHNICIEQELSRFCADLYVDTPDEIDEHDNLTLAVALFILDSIEKSGNYYLAAYFIPHDDRINEIILPHEFQDTVYTNEIIKGVMYLLENRHVPKTAFYSTETASLTKEKCCFPEYRHYAPEPRPREVSEDENMAMILMDEYDDDDYINIYKTAEKMTIRERYDALISFIRPEIIERSVRHFHDKCFDFIDIILGYSEEAGKECLKIAEEARKNVEEAVHMQNLAVECKKKMIGKISKLKNSKNVLSVLSNPYPGAMNYVEEDDQMLDDELDILMNKRDISITRLDSNSTELFHNLVSLTGKYSRLVHALYRNINTAEDDAVKAFSIKNPYEIIFGFMYSLDNADSLAWIPIVLECVLGYAAQQLPWNLKYNEVLFDKVTEILCNAYEKNKKSDQMSVRLYNRFYEDDEDKYEEEYRLKYTDAYQFVREDLKYHKEDLLPYNLAQVIYSNSYVVPPRYEPDRYEKVQSFVKSGFSRKQAELMCYYKAFADAHVFGKRGLANVYQTENLIKERSAEGLTKISREDLLNTVSEKNNQIDKLKKKLYSSERRAAELEKQISGIHEKYESDNQELLELRNLIYKIQNSSEDEEEQQDTGITFPYRTNARVVVFGGHATWLKVIVKLLPNVKFIDPYADPDVNTIRNADVVWMQTNAMPHNKYSKIMEIVRMKKIPVKYFAYASPEKCAVQLAEYDNEKD